MAIDIILNGANGKMGKVLKSYLTTQNKHHDLRLVSAISSGDSFNQMIKNTPSGVVVVDFTTPSSVFENTQKIIASGAHPVIGTTGLIPAQVEMLKKQCEEKKIGGVMAPNFSLSAVLMMRYASDAIKYLPHAEIIEMHHIQKKDAPSGTALQTASRMREALSTKCSNNISNKSRNFPIHSVRLPSLLAHQSVILSGENETLTLRSDIMNRESFIPGILLACRKAVALDHLVYGLENIL